MKKTNLKTKITSLVLAVMMIIAFIPTMTLSVSAAKNKGLIWPTPGYDMSCPYGAHSMCFDGVPDHVNGHDGIDTFAKGGTPIIASHSGIVDKAEWWGGYGNCVILNSTSSSFSGYTLYAHANSLVVKKGDRVNQGDVIGYVGTTGNSGGNHLHFEVWSSYGVRVNPRNYVDPDDKIGTNTSTATTSANISNGWYIISTKLNNKKCIDIKSGSKANGATTILQDFSSNGGDNQQFYFERLSDGTYRIKAKHSNLYLEVRNSSRSNFAEIAQWEWNDSYACKRWYIIDVGGGYYTFVNKESGKVMDVNGAQTANGTKISQYEKNNTDAQKFKLISVSTSNTTIKNPYPAPTRWLYLNDPMLNGNDVKWLQWSLNRLGFNCGEVDGIFGRNTHNALIAWQRKYNLDPDGIFGNLSLAKMKSLID